MTAHSRFVVGIDLGTTNSALAFVDAQGAASAEAPPDIQSFSIPQVVAPGEVTPRAVLPSFLYLPAKGEFPGRALDLPWSADPASLVGEFARAHGALSPMRLVSSAKSWLCHAGVDRATAILPWEAPPEVERLSPVEASARYLVHLCAAWDAGHPDAPLREQEILLTVPASFDAAARELTAQAAERAGLAHTTLLEEPQAAFYSWLARRGERWRKNLSVGDVVLVCDIGGGTTDFSLIEARDDGQGGLALERLAVGDHILLGGDNMDLALAFALRTRLADEGHALDAWQMRALALATQKAKEVLLADGAPDQHPVTILGRGSRVIGGTLRTELTREQLEKLLVDGFFPRCAREDRPARGRRVGLQEVGLPYAADAAITRHLAKFTSDHRHPTAVLFNGGVMKGEPLRTRVVEALTSWNQGDAPRVLEGTDLDLAVAHGAAYYGMVRRGRGIRIRGGTARAYYIGIESTAPAVPGFAPPLKALCVAPRGMEEGTGAVASDRTFSLIVGEPAEFRFLASTTRTGDHAGTLVEEVGPDLEELAPVQATLDGAPGAAVPVTIESKVTEVGTLELYCVAKDGRRWKLEYSVREAKDA
jgi:molecular chaperone DnaK (HSP70)